MEKRIIVTDHSLELLSLIIFIVLIFSACQTQSRGVDDNSFDTTSSESSGTTLADVESNELTMAVFCYDVTHLKNAAFLYEEKSGIKINIQNNYVKPDFFSSEYLLNPYPDTSKYTEQTLIELMARSGADIYDVAYLDFEQLGKNGLLADMNDWLESDNELSDEVLFRNTLLSGKTENGVFAIPIDFELSRLCTLTEDEPLLNDKRMTWQEFMSEVSELDYTQEFAYWSTDLNLFMERFISRASYFIDEAGNTQKLYSDEMISLLEECRDWGDMGLCESSRNLAAWPIPASYGGVTAPDRPAEMLSTIPEEYSRRIHFFAPKPFDGDAVYLDGTYRYPEAYGLTSLYGVNAGSPRKEIAQDFLRFLLSAEVQYIMAETKPVGIMFPVNRTAFRSLAESDLERIQSSVSTVEMDISALISEAEETVDQIAYFIIHKPYYRTIIREVAKQYFLDKITAEEAARQMSDKVGLYLKEQG